MFQLQPSLSIADIINALLLSSAVVALLFSLRQARQSNRTQRALFFRDLHFEFIKDEEFRDIIDLAAAGVFTYGPDFYGSRLERVTDRLLGFLDVVCSMYLRRLIIEQEMGFFNYIIVMLWGNDEIRNYLTTIESSLTSKKHGLYPFSSLLQYAKLKFPDAVLNRLNQALATEQDTGPTDRAVSSILRKYETEESREH